VLYTNCVDAATPCSVGATIYCYPVSSSTITSNEEPDNLTIPDFYSVAGATVPYWYPST
jgi:hypothetical protein